MTEPAAPRGGRLGPPAHSGPRPDEPTFESLEGWTGRDRKLGEQLLRTVEQIITDRPSTLDLRIAAAALEEMRAAFAMFAPYRQRSKVTIFGSARTAADDPLYQQAKEVAAALAADGWMVVTGAGPGIMQAAMEGAGREQSIGVSIRLPFETGANPVILGDSKWVSMRYFFTRKLMLVKESQGFVCLPGGFGTLDEMFELLTLTQTGKGLPVPIVLLDTEADDYWERVDELIRTELLERGLVSPPDCELYRIARSPAEAARQILDFYANFHSLRQVGEQLVIRVREVPSAGQLAELNERFVPTLTTGPIVVRPPLEAEVRDEDHLDLPRLVFPFDRHRYGALRTLIDSVNTFVR